MNHIACTVFFLPKVFGNTPVITVVKQHKDVDQVIAHQKNFTFFIRKSMIRQDVDIMEISCLAVSQECPFSIYTHVPSDILFCGFVFSGPHTVVWLHIPLLSIPIILLCVRYH